MQKIPRSFTVTVSRKSNAGVFTGQGLCLQPIFDQCIAVGERFEPNIKASASSRSDFF